MLNEKSVINLNETLNGNLLKLFSFIRFSNTQKDKRTAQKRTPRGRRFTVGDKILALSIYKHSGRSYRFLSQIFSLPLRKVLTDLINRIPFHCGINESIFAHLEKCVSKVKPINKICILMFDEVALSPGLQHNSRTDSIEGFVEYGGSNRRLAFADNALTFMLKGIHKKWKHAVCFTLCEGTTSILKEVVRHVRKCGLQMVATMSDQGATNQAAINRLIADTNKYFAEQERENSIQGYLIDGIEIVHLFDFPHLMKCIRNMLLNKDLHFVQQGKRKVASWSHVIRLYQLGKSRGVYSQFVKLTDEHVIPEKIRKMKVKNCTQVFSHTVETAMYVAARISSELPPKSEFYLTP
jgi:hypothetical protein